MAPYLSPCRKYIVAILFSLFAAHAFPQQKTNYSLLWKITGKGMSKPSYLFGTMHVKDKRVFNFSDSVMLSLQSCTRFALEVHPDTLMIKMFASLQNSDSLRNIDKLLSKEQYEALAKKFQVKNGYEMGKTDPMLLESLMEQDDKKPNDEVSFIDAYLYGIARTLNKNIMGLEDAASQFDQYYGSRDAIRQRLLDLLDDDVETEKDESKEEMIKIYSTGNLDEIYKYIINVGMIDSTIIARNKVMAGSMIKYMADEPLFTAVGAAHLPGPDGVIALLRQAGYTVTRVQANFTGIADTYHIDYMKMNWPAHRDENMGYSVNFPGTPIKYITNGVSTFIYPDMANDVYYGVYAVPRGTSGEPGNSAEIISKFLTTITTNPKNRVISRKDFVFNKMPCTEIMMNTVSGFMRMRLVLANNLLYSFYAGSKVNRLNQPATYRFLNSFTSFPVKQKAPVSWITFKNTEGAFTVKMPGQPQTIVKDVPSKIQTKNVSFKLNMYVSTDTLNSISYLARYNDFPAGTFIDDKEAVLNAMVEDYKKNGKIIGEPVTIWMDNCEGREVKAILKGGFYTTIRVYLRGNRTYVLLKEIIQSDLKDNFKDDFFDSFKFTPYIGPPYYNYQPDNGSFSVKMVSKPEVSIDSAQNYTSYFTNTVTAYSTDPNSGGLYGFEHSKISPYFRVPGVDSLYKRSVKNLVDYKDSLLKLDTISVGGIKGREVTIIEKEGKIKKRTRLLINGDDVFYFTGRVESAALFDKTSDSFYNSLIITHPDSSKFDLSGSKAEKICNDIASPDTTISKKATGAISYYDFTTTELPYVYTALNRNYADDTSSTGTRSKLITKLETVNTDSTAKVLVNLYPKLKGNDDLKAAILCAIPVIDKKTGNDIYFKLFIADPPLKAKETYGVFKPLIDSEEFAAVHFEQILPLIKYDNFRNNILRVARGIANKKDSQYGNLIRVNYPAIMANANSDMDKYIALKDSSDNKWMSYMYNYMQLAGKVKSADFNDKLTKRYIEKDPDGLYLPDAIIARINNNLPVNPVTVNKFLDSIGTRYDVMEALNNQNQLSRVPLKYRTQQAYAKLCLYQSISSDDYGNPTKITLLGSIIKNGKVYFAFKYLLTDKDEKNELIGITGPYKSGSTRLNFERYYAYTDYDVLKNNWRLQATKMIKPLIDAYE